MLKSMKKKLNETKGFTLIEVIVVLVIIAILMAIAVPNVLGYINRAKGTSEQAAVRSVYMAATAESAEILKTESSLEDGDDTLTTHLDKVCELCGLDPDDDPITSVQNNDDPDGTASTSLDPPGDGKFVIYVKGAAVTRVAYKPTTDLGYGFLVYEADGDIVEVPAASAP